MKTPATMTAYGLDLAGFSGGKSGFARADAIPDGCIIVTVYDGHPFANKKQRRDPIAEQIALEWQWVWACVQRGAFLVDTPIDMQGLPNPEHVTFLWELTMRPVDRAFGAMPPFADRIGAPAARFQHVMNAHQKKLWPLLGERLYETYPAATLALLDLTSTGKSKDPHWVARLSEALHMRANAGATFTHDELDAAICAITGVAGEHLRLQGEALTNTIKQRLNEQASAGSRPPEGYVLLKAWPQGEIRLTRHSLARGADALAEVTGERGGNL